ncbi:MAG TPA: azurin [Opitutaceae bacterium]
MKPSVVLFIAACGLALSVGCGKKESAEKSAPPDSSKQAPAGTATAGRIIEITGNDTMKFSLTEIRAKPGETLTVALTNIGTMPKFSMGHNWVLLKSAAVVNAFVADAPQAATTDYLPPSHKDDMLAHTKLLGPKEKDSVTFQAPKETGRYPYLCSFPGHYQVGMKGELIVEP